jgi:hypothetical protein
MLQGQNRLRFSETQSPGESAVSANLSLNFPSCLAVNSPFQYFAPQIKRSDKTLSFVLFLQMSSLNDTNNYCVTKPRNKKLI